MIVQLGCWVHTININMLKNALNVTLNATLNALMYTEYYLNFLGWILLLKTDFE